jgi:nicotinamidase-related amidase
MTRDATTPHAERSALLTIDVQRDFLDDGSTPVPGTTAVLPAVARVAGAFREASRPIVHVVRFYAPDGANAERCRRDILRSGVAIARPGTRGAELAEGILPPGCGSLEVDRLMAGELQAIGSREWVAYKPRWSAFWGTRLHAFLHDLDVDTVVVAGCNYPNCPRATMYEATSYDYRVAAVSDAISRFDERAVSELAAIGVHAMSVAECAAWLRAPRARSG